MSAAPERGPAAYLAEFIGTFALVFFITLTVSLYVTPPVNGVQPFIDFSVIGPALVGHGFSPDAIKWVLTYVVGPCVGGLAAALAYHTMFILPGKKGVEGMEPVG